MVLTKERRNEVVISLLPRIRRIAANIYKHLPEGSVDFDDLVQEGVLGVIRALSRLKKDSFAPDGKLSAEATAFLLIRAKGAIYDFLRSLDFGSKKVRAKEKKLEEVKNSLRERLKREPTDEEVAEFLGMDLEELYRLEEKISFSYFLSLEEIFNENFKGGYENFVTSPSNVEREVEKRELIRKLTEALKTLNNKEVLVLQLLFFENLKTQEVAKVLDLSTGRVTRIKKSALKKLAKAMERFL